MNRVRLRCNRPFSPRDLIEHRGETVQRKTYGRGVFKAAADDLLADLSYYDFWGADRPRQR